METRELGRSGIAVSRVILGCGNFGGVGSAPEFFGQGISEDEAFAENVQWGIAPTWSAFALAIPVGDDRLHRDRDRLESRRGGARSGSERPALATSYTAVAVFAIYFTLPAIALSALPVERTADGEYETLLGAPARGGWICERPDPRRRAEPRHRGGLAAGRARDLRRRARGDDPLHRDERRRDRRVADHVRDGGLPAAAGDVPAPASDASRRRGSRSSCSPGSSDPDVCFPGQVDFLGTMYSFGAMLSFTIAHVSLVVLRYRRPGRGARVPRRGPIFASSGSTGRCSRFSARLGTGLAFLVLVVQNPETR